MTKYKETELEDEEFIRDEMGKTQSLFTSQVLNLISSLVFF
jgi:hypothetical protein